jgi:hypothetical protein
MAAGRASPSASMRSLETALDRAQLRQEINGRLIAPLAILLETSSHQAREACG